MPRKIPDFDRRRFFLLHGALIPFIFLLLAWSSSISGLDVLLSDSFFDFAHRVFPMRNIVLLEILGHRLAKSAIYILWLGLFTVAALGRLGIVQLARETCRTLWLTVLGMSLGPLLVTWLKNQNDHHCPWDLFRYGGAAEISGNWFSAAADPGYCFPGGHAAAGFSLIALMFAGYRLDKPILKYAGLAAALVVGGGFSVIRMAQGAHFLSHNLAAAAICWALAALVFAVPRQGAEA